MNIVFVNATRRFGGVKAWTLDLCAQLDALGHKTWIFARPGPFLDKARAMGLDAREGWFGFDYHPVRVRKYFKFFKDNAVDALVANVGKDLRIAGIAARLAGVPVVHRVGLPRDMRDTLKVRNTHRFTKPAVLVPCEDTRRELIDEMSFLEADDVTSILTGKNPSPEPPASPRTPRRIAVTSQLNPDKGHADLLQALKLLADKGRDFRLHVAGTGRVEADLKNLADKLGLDDRITWHGFTSDVPGVLDRADIFCLPSLSEGLPNTLMEGMSRGLVPVARAVGGVPEVWPYGLAPLDKTLIPVDKGPQELATALDTLLSQDDETLGALKTKVYEWFAATHSLEVRARQFEQYITDLITR